jgi:hypothetical protein
MEKRWMTYLACALPLGALGYGYLVVNPAKAALENAPRVTRSPRHFLRLASDSAAAEVGHESQPTTIDAMLGRRRPRGLEEGHFHKRHAPFETTLWSVEVTVVESVLRADGDYYLVIESPTGARTVAEIPDPRHLADSHYREQISAARESIRKKLNPTGQPSPCRIAATIEGIGFFGKPSRTGNGARINPVVHIRWRD